MLYANKQERHVEGGDWVLGKRGLDALRAPEGGNAGDVDAAVVQAEEIARRKVAAIRGASAGRDGTDADERTLAANRKVIDDLARRLTTFGDERQQFTDQALGRLSGQATGEQRAEVERLANALYDEKLAR